MRSKILCTLFCLFSFCLHAERYGNIWQFGSMAGIDFNQCLPLLLTDGVNTGFEGCASYCDGEGDLIFYTNSDTVWNRFHQVMPSGHLVGSSGSLSQVIIIPKPGSIHIYYIITTKVQAAGSLTLQYHEIDMQADNGRGDVISANNVMTSLIVTEQIAATWQSNNFDIWLMTHEYGTNNFLAFSVTSNGINTSPVISPTGPSHTVCTSNINARGQIKFSPDGYKLAFNGNGIGGNDATNILAIFDFDRTSGVVSHPIDLPYCRGEFGLSFSPDGSKLYGSTWKAFSFSSTDYNYLYQFDLSSADSATIAASRIIIDSLPLTSGAFGDLKLAPDGRIFLTISNASSLGVINSPDHSGLACNYSRIGLSLGTRICNFGLNNYIEYTSYCDITDVENVKENNLLIYPNPVSDVITVELNEFVSNGKLRLFNSVGQALMEKDIVKAEKISFSIVQFPPGLYYLSLENDLINSGKIKLVISR
jgi:hypothetical protein